MSSSGFFVLSFKNANGAQVEVSDGAGGYTAFTATKDGDNWSWKE